MIDTFLEKSYVISAIPAVGSVGWIRRAFLRRNPPKMVDYGKKRLIHPTIFATAGIADVI